MHKPYHSSPRRRCTPISCESKSPQTWHHVFLPTYGRAEADDAQRLKIRIGFWGILCYNYNKEPPQNHIGNYLGRYFKVYGGVGFRMYSKPLKPPRALNRKLEGITTNFREPGDRLGVPSAWRSSLQGTPGKTWAGFRAWGVSELGV